jgi:hypothetical protein
MTPKEAYEEAVRRIREADETGILEFDLSKLALNRLPTELHYIYQRSIGEKEDFLRRIIPLRLDDARFGTWRDRSVYTKHWRAEFEEMEVHFKDLGEGDFRLYKAMQDWHNHVADMLAFPLLLSLRLKAPSQLFSQTRRLMLTPTGSTPGHWYLAVPMAG